MAKLERESKMPQLRTPCLWFVDLVKNKVMLSLAVLCRWVLLPVRSVPP